MFNFAFHEKSKAKAKAAMRAAANEHDDDMLTTKLTRAVADLIDAMPDAPKNGAVLISVTGNVPLGGYDHNLTVEIAFSPNVDLAK